jgi:hypothetical protein
VSYLADTTRQPESINDAMRLLECVSNECNYAGKKYVSEHFNDCYDSLTTRISKLRSENQFSESNEFFQTHRITTLTKALLSGTDNRISSFLLSEMELIRNTNHGNINLDSLSYNGATPLGEYLRVIYKESGTKSFTATIQGSFIEALRSDTGSVLVYYSYALASEDLPKLKEIEFSKGQMDFVVLGTLSAALWYRYYWDRKATPPLLSYLDKINTDQDVKDYIDRRFDGFR